MNAETTDLHAVLAADGLHQRRLPCYPDQLLASISFLIQLTDITTSHGFCKWNVDGVMDALEPDSYVGDERHLRAQLRAYLPLVDVVCQTVRDDVISEKFDIILGAWFCACA